MYGRGAADDKSGIVAHLAALRALDGKPPVHVKVLVEGSEENGRQALLQVVDAQPELMRADVMVIADNGNWKVGEPTLSQTLRGHGKLTVTLRTLTGALHSGHFGGAAPDALLALTRLIATLHDDDGSVAVEGLQDGDWDGAEWPQDDFRRQAGVLDGVQLVGTGDIGDRVWARHAISVLGLDAPAVDGAGNIVIPHARAKIAVRVPPGADPVALDGGRRAPRPRARAVGRADRDRGRAGVDADRAAGARSRRDARSSRPSASRWPGWAAAARSRSWPSCATPTRTRRSCSGARRTQTSPASTPPTSRSDLARSSGIALAEALLLRELSSGR